MLMYEIWYDYVKPKYGEKEKLCCKDIDIVCVALSHFIHKNLLHDYMIYYMIYYMTFIRTLQKMLKLNLILQVMN